MMIETTADLTRFQLENQQGDWIVHAIPVDGSVHSAMSYPSLIFIRNILTGKSYYYSCNHPDSKSTLENVEFRMMLRSYTNRKWALDKKTIVHMLGLTNVCDVNLLSWMQTNDIFEESEYETSAHYLVWKNASGHSDLNLVIPLMKHKEAFDNMADELSAIIKNYEPDSAFTSFNDDIIGTLGELEKQGIFVDREKYKERYKIDPGHNGMVWSRYNCYTATGRPSNSYGGVNFAALNQSDGTRKCFRSRYGDDGCMVMLDYTSFHPRIVSHLVQHPVPTDIDIYAYLAKLYFNKKDVDETDIKNAKELTFRQFYGGIEDKYLHIKYLANIKEFTDNQWALFNSQGYVETPVFKRRITAKHISEPNPPKVFNYLLQGVEGELAIPKVKAVLNYLKDKHTKAILYTYDAVLYDFYKPDGMDLILALRDIMSFDGRFPMKAYMGETYDDVTLISV
jgi:hypothetical protein